MIFSATMGVDPGQRGALAILHAPDAVTAFRLPAVQVLVGKTKRWRPDTLALLELMRACSIWNIGLCAIEKPFGMRGQSASAAVTYGETCGLIRMAVHAASIPVIPVSPGLWKKRVGCPKDKAAARLAASQLFPASAHQWPAAGDHDIAEAVWLALYAQRTLTDAPTN